MPKDQPQFAAHDARFSSDGTLLAWQTDRDFRIADAANGVEKARFPYRLEAQAVFPRLLGFTPDSRAIVTVENDVRVFDVAKNNEIGRFLGWWQTTALALDGKTVASVSLDGALHLIDVGSGRYRVAAERLPRPTALAISPDAATIAVGFKDGSIGLFDSSTLKQQRRLTGNVTQTLELAFSPDGSALAALHGDPQAQAENFFRDAQLWQLPHGDKIELLRAPIWKIAFAPHGQTLAMMQTNGVFNIYDIVTRQFRQPIGAPMQGRAMFRIVFTPDGHAILTADNRGNALLRSVTTGRILATLSHSASFYDAAFTPDGRTLATAAMDPPTKKPPEVKLWERMQ